MVRPLLRPRPLLALVLALLALLAPRAAAQELQIHVIDVGQGLAVYVQGPTGVRLLYDGGNPGDGSGKVIPYLQSIGVSGLDYTVMSHWHTDHFGGLTEVHGSSFAPALAAYDRGDAALPSNVFVTAYLAAVGGKRQIATLGQVIDLGGGASAQVAALDGSHLGGGTVGVGGDENARSIALVVRYGDFDCWLPGDLTAGGLGTPDVEGPASAAVGQVELVVSGHHGSSSSSSSQVVASLDPSLVVHSAGHDNPYGHPTEGVVDAWSSPAATRVQWCTTEGDTVLSLGGFPGGFNGVQGSIRVRTDGVTFVASSTARPEEVRFATFENPGLPAGAGQLALTEVLVDPALAADAYGEWFELLNETDGDLDLGGLRVSSGPQSFTLRSRVLVPGLERFVVGVDGRRSRNGDLFPGVNAPWQQFGLANGSGSLTLRSAGGATIEMVAWGSGGFAVQPGVSAERVEPGLPPSAVNFAPATQAWSGGDLGSPWAINAAELAACPTPQAYGSAKLTSIGTAPFLTSIGTPSLYTDDFLLVLYDGVPGSLGLAFFGNAPAALPFQGGTLLVQPPVLRLAPKTLDIFGGTSYAIAVDAALAGATRYYQFWFRDPNHPDGTAVGLSSALEVTYCPAAGGAPKVGDVIVTEIMKDPTAVPDTAGEWFEVRNVSAQTIDLEGWRLVDDGIDSHVIATGGAGLLLQPGQQLVLGSNASSASNGGIPVAYAWSSFFLGNGSDTIELRSPQGATIDRVAYGTAPLWPDTPGRALQLDPGSLSAEGNDDPANWCSASAPIGGGPDFGTPAQPNGTCP